MLGDEGGTQALEGSFVRPRRELTDALRTMDLGGKVGGLHFEFVETPGAVADGEEFFAVGPEHVHDAGLEYLKGHALKPNEVHAVFGVVPESGLEV
ncbi:MAG: hypothetical protein ACKV2O_01675 [Acidimicrobiales bacterium]